MSNEETAELILDLFMKNPKTMCLVESRVHALRVFDPLITVAHDFSMSLHAFASTGNIRHIIKGELITALVCKYRGVNSDSFRFAPYGAIVIEYWVGLNHPDNFKTDFTFDEYGLVVSPPDLALECTVDYPKDDFKALFRNDFVITDMNQYWSQIHPFIEWAFTEMCDYYENVIRKQPE